MDDRNLRNYLLKVGKELGVFLLLIGHLISDVLVLLPGGTYGQYSNATASAYYGQYSNRRIQPLCNKCGCCKPRYVNPCAQGPPIMTPFGLPAYCNYKDRSSCPNSHFCHVGITVVTTCCCPMPGDPCTMPPNSGQGSASLPRFFFDKVGRTCKPFMYRGIQGNANNFVTKQLCEATCPAIKSPCALGPPATDPAGLRVPCSVVSPTTCPATFWCHIGPSADTTACCPGAGNPCTQPLLTGEGTAALPRFYFDPAVGACRSFAYLGTKGNQNNFLSKADCEAACRPFENPCVGPVDPARAIQCSPPGLNPAPCPPGFFCHLGASPATTLCCPSAGDPCQLPRSEGVSGRVPVSLSRWYFDRITRQCVPFVYRGLKGNANNFPTLELCRQVCAELNPCQPPDTPFVQPGQGFLRCQGGQFSNCPNTHFCLVGDGPETSACCPRRGSPCDQPKQPGVGPSALERWSYDAGADECSKFTYRGLQGNENNFMSAIECEETCVRFGSFCPHGRPLLIQQEPQTCSVETACPQDYVCHINAQPQISLSVCCPAPASFCFLPRDSGPCDSTETRFGYEPASNTCVQFRYGGCGGNLNNFKSLEKCTDICCDQF